MQNNSYDAMWSVLSAVIRGSSTALGSMREKSKSNVKKGAEGTMTTEASKHEVKTLEHAITDSWLNNNDDLFLKSYCPFKQS